MLRQEFRIVLDDQMSDQKTRTVAYFLGVFHEDDGLRIPVTLNAFASCNPTVEFVEAALTAMEDNDWIVRARGAQFLGIARIDGRIESIPAAFWARAEASLRERLQDSETNVRCEAALALGRLAPSSAHARLAFPILFSIADDPDSESFQMQDVAKATLHFASALPQEVIRLAPKLLHHSDPEVVCFGLQAVAQCGNSATPFLPLISSLAKSDNNDIRDRANEALQRLGQKPATTLWAKISQLFRRSVTL
jgi:hypothetical protein